MDPDNGSGNSGVRVITWDSRAFFGIGKPEMEL